MHCLMFAPMNNILVTYGALQVLYCIVLFFFFSFFYFFMYFEYENDNIYPTGADPLSRVSLRSDVGDR